MEQEKFSLKKRFKSFSYAFNGVKILFKEEHNARIHLFAVVIVITAGVMLNISIIEWLFIIFSIGFVFAMEFFNSSIENISDFISPEKHDMIKKIKDLAAGGVLTSAITAFIIGCTIFLPKILNTLKIHL